MKSIIGLICVIASCQAFTFSNCNNGAFIKVDQILPNSQISSSTKLNVKFTSTSTHTDASLNAIVTVDVSKKNSWFGYVRIPNWVISAVAPSITASIKGVTYQSANKFIVGCDAAKAILKQCPPPKGTYDVNTDLGPIFKMIKEKVPSAILSSIGSGTYKIQASVKIQKTGETLACIYLNNLEIVM